jgi:hypothetical protein
MVSALLSGGTNLDPLCYYSSIVNDRRPSGICGCLDDDGDIDMGKWKDYQDKKRELRTAMVAFVTRGNEKEDDTPVQKPPRKRARLCKSRKPFSYDDEGEEHVLRLQQTWWYLSYILHPTLEDDKFNNKFRRRFRMPHAECMKLIEKVKDSELFRRWCSWDATGLPSSPIELLVMGALRYLGRGLTFESGR